MKSVQPAFPHPDSSWSRKMSPKIEMSNQIPLARGLGLPPAEFQRLMDERKVTVLCERGIGEDAGLYRATFYYDGRRVRLVVDADGNVVEPA